MLTYLYTHCVSKYYKEIIESIFIYLFNIFPRFIVRNVPINFWCPSSSVLKNVINHCQS